MVRDYEKPKTNEKSKNTEKARKSKFFQESRKNSQELRETNIECESKNTEKVRKSKIFQESRTNQTLPDQLQHMEKLLLEET